MNLVDLTVREFITKLGSPVEGPGGGSASALIGLSGVALLKMVAGRTPSLVSQQELAELEAQLIRLIDEDQRAFAALVDLQSKAAGIKRKPPDDQLEQAVIYAIEVPLAIVKACIAGLRTAQQAITTIDCSMLSELIVAAEALQAGAASSIINMKVNLAMLQNAEIVATYVRLMEQYLEQGRRLLSIIYQQTAGERP